MVAGEKIDPFQYEGDLVLTCFAGEFSVMETSASVDLVEMNQAVIPTGTMVALDCMSSGSIHVKEALAVATGTSRIAFTAEQRRRLALKGKALTPEERGSCCLVVRPDTL